MLQIQTIHYIKRLTNCQRLLIHLKPSNALQYSDEGPSGPNFSGETIKKFSKVVTDYEAGTVYSVCLGYGLNNRGIVD